MSNKGNSGLDALKNAISITANSMGKNILLSDYVDGSLVKGLDSKGNECLYGPSSLSLARSATVGSPYSLHFEKGNGKVKMRCSFTVSTDKPQSGVVPYLMSDISSDMEIDGAGETVKKRLSVIYTAFSPQAIEGETSMSMEEFEYFRKAFSESRVKFKWNALIRWADASDPEVLKKIQTENFVPEERKVSVGGEFCPFIASDDENAYSKVRALLCWERVVVGEEKNEIWFKDTMENNTYCLMPQMYRIMASPYTNAPQMTIALVAEDKEKERYKMVMGFSVGPYYHPKAKRDLYSILSKRYGINHCTLDYGGYESAVFQFDKEFSEGYLNKLGIKAIIQQDKINTSPDTSFSLSLESSLDAFRLFRDKLKEGGIYIGDVVLSTKNGLSEEPFSIRLKVELDLHKLTNCSVGVRVLESEDKKIKFAHKIELSNNGEYVLEVGGCEMSYFSTKKKKIREIRHGLVSDTPLPVRLEAGGRATIGLSAATVDSLRKKDRLRIHSYWSEIVCEPYSIHLSDSDISLFVNRIEDMATNEVDVWKLNISAVLAWENYPELVQIEVNVRNDYGVDETVVLRDTGTQTVTMAKNLTGILSSQDIEGKKYQFRYRVVTSSAVTEWSEWQEGKNFETSLYIFNNNINKLIESI